MKDFQKLSRAEMKKVMAGESGGCGVGKSCTFFLNDPSHPFSYEAGTCVIKNNACLCVATNGDAGASPDCSAV